MRVPKLLLPLLAWLPCACGILDSGPDVRVFVTASRARLVPGDSTTISVILTNVSDRVQTLSSEGCLLRFEVRDSTQAVVAPGLHGCADMLASYRLEPGAALSRRVVWFGDRYEEDSLFPWPGRLIRVLLAPASYGVAGVLEAEEMRARSAPTTVTLVPYF